ncbi:MAG TPA: type II TA system antitoxin MqsA family protein [Longimicrobiaceae bacterium]|nr:type II TA system antitoxin MqsA family protein [Longimicrobiaceae bacterium]
MQSCPVCGGGVSLVREVREITIGRRTASVEAELYRCAACGEELLEPAMADALMARAAAKIREADATLLPAEIAAIRRDLGYTQAELEAILNTGAKTVTRWERGTVTPTGPADTLLRVLAQHPDIAHGIAAEKGIRGRTRQPADLPKFRGQ